MLDNAKAWVQLYPGATDAYHELAQAYMNFDKVDEAIQAHKTIYQLDPTAALELHHIGELYQQKNQPEKALTYYQQYAEKFPKQANSFKELGNCYAQMGDFNNASASYNKALLIEPEEISTQTKIGKLFTKSGDFQQAFTKYQSALASSTSPQDSSSVYEEVADYYELRGQITQAITATDKRLTQLEKFEHPLVAKVQRFISLVLYAKAGRQSEALVTLNRLIAGQMHEIVELNVRIVSLAIYTELEDADKLEEALEALKPFNDKIPAIKPYYHFYRGVAQAMREQYPQAIESYSKGLVNLEFRPESFRLAASYRMFGELDKAEISVCVSLSVCVFLSQCV